MNNEQQLNLVDIIKELYDFSDYSAEEKTKLIDETAGMIMEVSLLRSLDEQGATAQDAFNDFLETKPSEDQMVAYIAEKLPNFNTILFEEIQKLQENKNTTS